MNTKMQDAQSRKEKTSGHRIKIDVNYAIISCDTPKKEMNLVYASSMLSVSNYI